MTRDRRWIAVRVGGLCLAVLCSCLLAPSSVLAQEEVPSDTGRLLISGGVDFATHYFFRGLLQEDQGLIAQPYAALDYKFYEGQGFLTDLTGSIGIWNSIHTGPTGSGGDAEDPRSWYELDLIASVGATLAEKWSTALIYTAYFSPNDSFNTIQEIALRLGYDDRDLLGKFALSPYVLVAFEIDDHADAGNTAGKPGHGFHEGIYLELGVAPGFTLIHSEKYPVSLSLPVTLGLSLKDYYQNASGRDHTFGFVDVGAVVGMPLSFIPSNFGTWEMSAGVHAIFLDGTTRSFNNGDSVEVWGVIGLSASF